MRLKELVEDGIDIFALEGEIDLDFAPALRSLFASKLQARCPALILDLHGVDFIDSTGLATFVEYVRDSGIYGGVLCLAALSESAQAIVDTVRLEKVLPIFASVPEAIVAMKQRIAAKEAARVSAAASSTPA